MLELLWLIVNIAMVVYVVKTIKENNKEQKKKKRKIWLSLLGVGIIIALIGGNTTQREIEQPAEIIQVEEQKQPTEELSLYAETAEMPISISDDDVLDKEVVEMVGEFASANTEEEIVTELVQKYIDNEYTKTSIDFIEVNPNYGTDDPGDYIALVHLIWNVQNDGDMSKKMLDMYSCKKQVETSSFRQFISSTFRQLKTSTFISALYPSQERIPGGDFCCGLNKRY